MQCDGTGSENSCVACIASGDCPQGSYFNSTLCDGTGRVDSCQTCRAWNAGRGEWKPPSRTRCATGTYLDTAGCDGTGVDLDDGCVACTALGACAAGEYFDALK